MESAEEGRAATGSPEAMELIDTLEDVRSRAIQVASLAGADAFGKNSESASNLLTYLTMRTFDLRTAQEKLAALGISSLGRAEGHVLFTLDAALRILYNLSGSAPPPRADTGVTPSKAQILLEGRAAATLGPRPARRVTRIMVTMPREAAANYQLVKSLLQSGMDCMRINCAHDTEAEWSAMVKNVRRAEKEVGRKCVVLMDIAGPKMRTGPFKPGPRVLKVRPEKDARGRVTKKARVALCSGGGGPKASLLPAVSVPHGWLEGLRPRARVHFTDASGAERKLEVVSKGRGQAVAEVAKTTYFETGLKLWYKRAGGRAEAVVGELPPLKQSILLRSGDRVLLAKSGLGTSARGRGTTAYRRARITCTLPEVIDDLRKGEKVWFDDGKIGAVVRRPTRGGVELEVTNAGPEGSKLQEDKGINLPESKITLPPLTPKDERDLAFISKEADLVGYSFVRQPSDVEQIRERLKRLGRPGLPIVLKVETKPAFDSLPSLLLTAMRGPPFAVMIARGDLAVECGYERLAEVQEEILWLCEAAHAPVIWATQVLEDLTKGGLPSRAEVTDAAMGERAECVMLNKGPHVAEAVKALGDILERMQGHQAKKSSMLRNLRVADRFFKEGISSARPGRA